MDPITLLQRSEQVIKSFNPINSTLDAHADAELFGGKDCAVSLANELRRDPQRVFIKQVLYGCVRYKQALKVAISSFYYNNSATTSRADYTKYMVLAYLAIFRLEEMGFQEFSKLVGSQPAEKMHVFLSYLFNKENLDVWIKDEWIKIFDLEYVENTLIKSILSFKPEVMALCERMSTKAFGMALSSAPNDSGSEPHIEDEVPEQEDQDDQSNQNRLTAKNIKSISKPKQNKGVPQVMSKPPTRPAPFNLTQPRPPRIPEPFKIKQGVPVNPLPKNLHKIDLKKLEEERKAEKAKNLEQTLEKYQNSKIQKFKFHKSRDKESKRFEDDRTERIRPFRANPVPDFSKYEAPMKTNTSAILREDALYKRKQGQEAQLLRSYEETLRDSTEYYAWQAKMKEDDDRFRLEQVEERRMLSVKSRHEAILANEKQLQNNKLVAAELKEQSVVMKTRLQAELQANIENNRKIVRKVQKVRQTAPIEARAKIKVENRKVGIVVKKGQKQRWKKKLEADKLEQERRDDLIRQIRAMEKVPVQRVVAFDPTSTGGHNLLEEMSLVELKERLSINKIREEAAENEIRVAILNQKRKKQAALKERILNIKASRKAAADMNRQLWAEKIKARKELEMIEKERVEEAQLELVKKLEAMRESRINSIKTLQEEEDKLNKQRMFLGAARDMVETTVHMQFLMGAERKARDEQSYEKRNAIAAEAIVRKTKAMQEEYSNKIAQEKATAKFIATEIEEKQMLDNKEENYKLVEKRKQLVRKERARYQCAQEVLQARNRYATKINRRCISKRK